jgi:uncharacterized membrane protein YvbJ
MSRKNQVKPKTPDVCPACGEDVPRGSLACRECGADHNSGWREDADAYDALDLPDEDFNYDKFVREEFGSRAKPTGVRTLWWVAAIVLIVVFVVIYFYGSH